MRSHSLTSYSLLTVLSVLLLCIPIQAQSTSSIEGQVTDQNGAVVPGAVITVICSAVSIHRKATTDQGGRYQIASCQWLTIALTSGPRAFRRRSSKVARKTAQNFQLQVGDVSEEIVVTPTINLIEQATISVGQVIDRCTVQEIPLKRTALYRSRLACRLGYAAQNGNLSAPTRGQGSQAMNT